MEEPSNVLLQQLLLPWSELTGVFSTTLTHTIASNCTQVSDTSPVWSHSPLPMCICLLHSKHSTNKSKALIPEQKETSACWQHNASLFLFPKHFCHTFVGLLYQPPGLEAAASISCHNDKQGKFSQVGAQHWTPLFLTCFSGAITISLPAWPSMPSLASCLPRMMLPQVAGSIWVVSLGAKWHSVGQFAGEAAGVGVAVPYQMDQGSQKTMKALITKGGKNQKWHICNKLNISIYLYWILQACSLASRAADSHWRLPMNPCFFLPSFWPYS